MGGGSCDTDFSNEKRYYLHHNFAMLQAFRVEDVKGKRSHEQRCTRGRNLKDGLPCLLTDILD